MWHSIIQICRFDSGSLAWLHTLFALRFSAFHFFVALLTAEEISIDKLLNSSIFVLPRSINSDLGLAMCARNITGSLGLIAASWIACLNEASGGSPMTGDQFKPVICVLCKVLSVLTAKPISRKYGNPLSKPCFLI